MAGESRLVQILFGFFCLILAANFVHASGLFNASSYYAVPDTGQVIVAIKTSANNGLGDIVNGITYGSGGGLWTFVNFMFNFGIPFFMLYDMGLHYLVAGLVTGLWWFFLVVGGLELLSNKEVLK